MLPAQTIWPEHLLDHAVANNDITAKDVTIAKEFQNIIQILKCPVLALKINSFILLSRAFEGRLSG